jgi:nicotinamide riboside kinase
MRVVNLFAGPGTGKSTTAAGLFNELKNRGVNAEYCQEFAKDAAWEKRGKKFFAAQQYIYGEQSWRMHRMKDEVDIMVTDCPLILGNVYMPDTFPMQSLRTTMAEDFEQYDNLNIFLKRNKPYNPKGRNQNFDEAKELDDAIMQMLGDYKIPFYILDTSRTTAFQIIDKMINVKKWHEEVPAITNIPSEKDLKAVLEYYYPQPVKYNCSVCKDEHDQCPDNWGGPTVGQPCSRH